MASSTHSVSGLRIAFFGTPEFAARILRDLVDRGENIVAVVTTPDKPQGRGRRLSASAVRVTAEELGIPVLTPSRHKDPEFLHALSEVKADVFVVVAYKILPPEVFRMPRLGTFNIHASLLPKYRGAAPINWAIIRGEQETGLTTFLLDETIDTGAILLQETMRLGPDETAGELHDRMMLRGAEIAQRTLLLLASGEVPARSQTGAQATTAPKIFPEDCKIDFDRPASDVKNFIRGLSPSPGAYALLPDGIRLKILRVASATKDDLSPGEFYVAGDHRKAYVGCGDGSALEIIELQVPGKRPMTAEELLRGHHDFFSRLHAAS
jgi:methionyl-tRNA formyltransferase